MKCLLHPFLPLWIQHTKFGKDIPNSFPKVQTTDDYGCRPKAISPLSDLFVPGQKFDNFVGSVFFFWGGGSPTCKIFQGKSKFR